MVTPPFRARVCQGDVRVQPVPGVRVLVEKTVEEKLFGLHIHTAYPIIVFKCEQVAWRDHPGVWHGLRGKIGATP